MHVEVTLTGLYQNRHVMDGYQMCTGQNGFKLEKNHRQSSVICYLFCACSKMSNGSAEHEWTWNGFVEC